MPIPITENYRYIQYTGFNSSELNDELEMTIISEADGVLVAEIPSGHPEKTIEVGQYVIYFENEVREIATHQEFVRRWRCVVLCDEQVS